MQPDQRVAWSWAFAVYCDSEGFCSAVQLDVPGLQREALVSANGNSVLEMLEKETAWSRCVMLRML